MDQLTTVMQVVAGMDAVDAIFKVGESPPGPNQVPLPPPPVSPPEQQQQLPAIGSRTSSSPPLTKTRTLAVLRARSQRKEMPIWTRNIRSSQR